MNIISKRVIYELRIADQKIDLSVEDLRSLYKEIANLLSEAKESGSTTRINVPHTAIPVNANPVFTTKSGYEIYEAGDQYIGRAKSGYIHSYSKAHLNTKIGDVIVALKESKDGQINLSHSIRKFKVANAISGHVAAYLQRLGYIVTQDGSGSYILGLPKVGKSPESLRAELLEMVKKPE